MVNIFQSKSNIEIIIKKECAVCKADIRTKPPHPSYAIDGIIEQVLAQKEFSENGENWKKRRDLHKEWLDKKT